MLCLQVTHPAVVRQELSTNAALAGAVTQQGRPCVWCAVDRLQEHRSRPVGSGEKAGDTMFWQKQMLLFIFGITPLEPWRGEEFASYFHSEPRTGNRKVKETQTLKS